MDMTMTTASGSVLYGDWRRRIGSSTDAHLWRDGSDYALPVCGKRIEHFRTVEVRKARPCYDCLAHGASGR